MSSTTVLAFGVLIAAAKLGSVLAEQIRIPKVTAYLLIGLALGPHGTKVVHETHFTRLEPFSDFAMALVLFGLGCQFSLRRFHVLLRKLVPISIGEQVTCFSLVALGVGFATGEAEVALLLGVLALATAPATTVLVLKEEQSWGPLTDLCGGLIVLNNLSCIVLLELALVGIGIFDGTVTSAWAEIGSFLGQLGLAGAIGVFAGLAVTFLCGVSTPKRWFVILVSLVALTLGGCAALRVPYLLAFLAMGLTVVNTSADTKAIVAELQQLTRLMCVLFFVLHGSHLHPQAFVAAGSVGLVYILCRIGGKYAGVWVTARSAKADPDVQKWLGLTLMAQAGVAITLSSDIANRGLEGAQEIRTMILGSVVFFEVIGPLLIRFSVFRAGELPLSQAIHHTSTTPQQQLNAMRNRLLALVGLGLPDQPSPENLTVATIAVANGSGLRQEADFDEVIHYIEHSHDNVFPVVDSEQRVTGVIRYSAISGAAFDPDATKLICADDLSEPVGTSVTTVDTVARVVELFNHVTDDCILVTDTENRLKGVVRRADVVNLLVRQGKE